MKIGVVGNGFVGHAMTLLRPHIEVLVWDVVPEKRDPKTLDIETFVEESEIIFVAVPTPMNADGSANLDIVRSVCEEIQEIDDTKYIVLRSTVPPGTSEDIDVYSPSEVRSAPIPSRDRLIFISKSSEFFGDI